MGRLRSTLVVVTLAGSLTACSAPASVDEATPTTVAVPAPAATQKPTAPGAVSNVCVDALDDNGWGNELSSATIRMDGADVNSQIPAVVFEFELTRDYTAPAGIPHNQSMGPSRRVLVHTDVVSAVAYIPGDPADGYTVREHWGGPVIWNATVEAAGNLLTMRLPLPPPSRGVRTALPELSSWYVEILWDSCPNDPSSDSNHLLTDVFAAG